MTVVCESVRNCKGGRTGGIARACGVKTRVNDVKTHPNTRWGRCAPVASVALCCAAGPGLQKPCALAAEAPANTQQHRSEPTPRIPTSGHPTTSAETLRTPRASGPVNSCVLLRKRRRQVACARVCWWTHWGV